MKRFIYNICICALMVFMLTSCFEELDNSYQGPLAVEFPKARAGVSALYTFSSAGQVSIDENSVVVQLIGPQQPNAITVNFEVDTDASTAVAGTHYELIDEGSITIPAGSSSANISFNALLDGFNGDPNDTRTLVFKITGSSVEIATNLSTLSVKMGITCPSDIPEGTWIETANGGESVTLTSNGDGTYKFSNFNIAYYNPSNNPISGTFVDVCNTLILQGASELGVQWRGEGTYDSENEVITFPQVEDISFNPGTFSGPYVFELQ